jgi:hypothetical protein
MIFPNEVRREDDTVGNARGSVFRIVVIFFLLAGLCFEGYYIFVLRAKIEKQAEELKNISIQLQSLNNERINLREELSSIKKSTNDHGDDHGNTADR